MNTINCRIKKDEYSDVPGLNVTPAEVLVLLSDDLHEAIRRVRLENNPNAIHKRAHLSPPQIAEDMSKARSANRATSLLPERKSS